MNPLLISLFLIEKKILKGNQATFVFNRIKGKKKKKTFSN
jgi:hypothetical protein